MPLSWNEIKTRAVGFTNEWKDEVSEDAEAKSFWDDFFNVFGIHRRRVASFEQQVKKIDDKQGFIDLLWKGQILIEHKSRGKDLVKAYQQAKDYFPGLKEKELPRYILVSDFERFHLFDLERNTSHEFKLEDFINHVHLFGFIAGYEKRTFKEQDPVNLEAATLMGKLHDKLEAIGYTGHALELYLVRLLFCLFADDTNIFEKGILQDYIDLRTDEDGSDLANHIAQLFEILNTPKDKRLKNLDESLTAFPYVNGKLFEEHLPTASFDSDMRRLLLECCLLDWGKISPAIFGSLFQSVMNPVERRTLGAHYTSEKNILKVIKPLFLDGLWKQFEKAKDSKQELSRLHKKISTLRFLDPACGCGNFLIIAYRELRLLEMEIVNILLKNQTVTDIAHYFLLDVDRFYGIEYEEFPAQVAQVAMWLIDHQMNMKASETFGEYYVRLPLRKSATIKHGNALRTDWQSLIEQMPWEKEEPKFDYIFGNPPFSGKSLQNEMQKLDMRFVFSDLKNASDLDYVSAWYKLACDYLNEFTQTEVSFVSTNSITQGEQVLLLWPFLINKYKIEINFAHTTFEWSNEARGNAHVHVVIVGFAKKGIENKIIYRYDNVRSDPSVILCKHINAYLIAAKDVFITKKQKPILKVPQMRCGNKPADGGFLILTREEIASLLEKEPGALKFIKKFIGSDEYLNKKERWCLWLKDIQPNELRRLPLVLERVNEVKKFRLKSTAKPTIEAANTPYQFFYISQPACNYIAIPEVSSERRHYVPLDIIPPSVISSNKIFLIESENRYLLGILSSIMHMSWLRIVAGRMKNDYSYSGSIVYNNFPWPENPNEKQIKIVEDAAQNVLDVRAKFPEASLADLYDPNTMPPELVKAHQALDKAVDLCYRPQQFINETKRIEFLFELYDKYTAGLFVKEKKKKS